jgi:hypothetical protein
MILAEEFEMLTSRLEAAHIEFAVCGGMALALHGRPRLTNDIDFLIRSSEVDRALEVAKSCGFEDTVESIKLGRQAGRLVEIQRINKFDGEDFLTLDFVVVSSVLEDVWTGCVPFKSGNRSLRVVSPAGLAKMKLLAGRPQDLLDIQTLGFSIDDPAIQP